MDILQTMTALALVLNAGLLAWGIWGFIRIEQLNKKILNLELARHGETSGTFSVYVNGAACVQHYSVAAALRAIMNFLNIKLVENADLEAVKKE